MAKIKLVVFDMDGTLLKPRSCWAYIHEHFGTDNSEMLKLYIEHKITDQEFVKADINLWEKKSDKKVNEKYINLILDEIEPIDGADRIHYYLGKSYQKIKDFEKSLFHLKESEIYEENAYWKEDYLDVLFHLKGIDNFKKEFEDIYQELDEEGNKSVIFNKIKDNSEGS